mgnify:CR=1 FL=1
MLSASLNAAVYKWTDENGNVVYGDKPPSKNADRIKIQSSPELDNATLERLENQQKLLDVMQQERDNKEEEN